MRNIAVIILLPFLVSGKIETLRETFDYIVVGAGSAGATVASRLSEDNFASVLLIEAGPKPPRSSEIPLFASLYESGTAINWNYTIEPTRESCLGAVHKRCPYNMGRTLGGSSQINLMLYVRGSKADYEMWKNKDGAVSWGYDDVLPFFKKSEGTRISDDIIEPEFHGTKGPQTTEVNSYFTDIREAYVKGFAEMGSPTLDYNGENQTGFGISQLTSRNGYRCSTNKAYLDPARSRKNFKILLNSLVTKIIIDKHNVAKGVHFIEDKKIFYVKAKKEVIVSGGAIKSPHILMLSGIGPRKHLEDMKIKVVADLPVGQNLQDHLQAPVIFTVSNSNESTIFELTKLVFKTKKSFDYPETLEGLLRSQFAVEAFGFLRSEFEKGPTDYNDLQLFLVSGIAAQGFYSPKLTKYFEKFVKKRGYSVLPTILHPKSKGNVTLRSNNPTIPPLIRMNYFSNPEDIKVLVFGMKKVRELATQPAFSKLNPVEIGPIPGCEKLKMKSDKYLECLGRTLTVSAYHAACTCKMGNPADPSTVVDPTLRVKGIKGLRVVDTSIMPRIVSGNTNAAAIMIGEKAADIIKKGLK